MRTDREKLKQELFEDVDKIKALDGHWTDMLGNYIESNVDEILDCYEEIFDDAEELKEQDA